MDLAKDRSLGTSSASSTTPELRRISSTRQISLGTNCQSVDGTNGAGHPEARADSVMDLHHDEANGGNGV